MIRAQIEMKVGDTQKPLGEMSFAERPLLGSEIGGKYKVVSISSPVPIDTNISAGESEMGIRICVDDLRRGGTGLPD